jgi:regulator of sirC expression with transglutaminase-like and TPR domain
MAEAEDPRETLRRVGAGPDDGFDIAGAALALAALDTPAAVPELSPQLTIEDYRRHLARIGDDLAAAARDAGDLAARCAALTVTMHEDYGFDGDAATYEDLQNANLMRVIDRRRGLPVALGILYIDAARRVGWDIAGLSFPGHFLLRLDGAGDRAVIDPFHQGRVCDAGEMRALMKAYQGADAELTPAQYRRVSDREVLLRLQNNVKLRFMQLDRFDAAARVVGTMLLFAPGALSLWREAGLLNVRAGNLGEAIGALETYLRHETRESARQEVATYLQRLRRRLN